MANTCGRILGRNIHADSKRSAYEAILQAAQDRRGGAAYFCNVHMLVEAYRGKDLAEAMAKAEWTLPDGMPVVAALRLLGKKQAQRVAGMDALPELCGECDQRKLSVFFYGCDEKTLRLIEQRMISDHPRLKIAGMYAPPYGDATPQSELEDVARIEASGAHLCFVSLGCPKQELWIARHRHQTGAVLLGVGAAFKTTTGEQSMAPEWMRKASLEWAYRLAQEPRRLARRYFSTNPRFVDRFLRQLWTR